MEIRCCRPVSIKAPPAFLVPCLSPSNVSHGKLAPFFFFLLEPFLAVARARWPFWQILERSASRSTEEKWKHSNLFFLIPLEKCCMSHFHTQSVCLCLSRVCKFFHQRHKPVLSELYKWHMSLDRDIWVVQVRSRELRIWRYVPATCRYVSFFVRCSPVFLLDFFWDKPEKCGLRSRQFCHNLIFVFFCIFFFKNKGVGAPEISW